MWESEKGDGWFKPIDIPDLPEEQNK